MIGPDLYEIEWTHDDGMDQHRMYAKLSPQQAMTIEARLIERGALCVEIAALDATYASSYQDVLDEIDSDLPVEGGTPA